MSLILLGLHDGEERSPRVSEEFSIKLTRFPFKEKRNKISFKQTVLRFKFKCEVTEDDQ